VPAQSPLPVYLGIGDGQGAYTEVSLMPQTPAWFRNARPSVVHTARLAAFLTVRLSRTEAEALLTPAMPAGMYLLRRSTKKRDALVLTLKTGPGAVKHMEVCESSLRVLLM
jgi:hypothetical protein